jgi:hypothetical protein
MQPFKKRPREATPQLSDGEDHGKNKAKRTRSKASPASPASGALQHAVVHKVECTRRGPYHEKHPAIAYFLDAPCLLQGANRSVPLKGQQPLSSIETYLAEHREISFTVCITYSCNQYHDDLEDAFDFYPMPPVDVDTIARMKPYFYVLREDQGPTTARAETILPSDDLREALDMVSTPESQHRSLSDSVGFIRPYSRLYYHRSLLSTAFGVPESSSRQSHTSVLFDYLERNISPEYSEAENLFQQGLVEKKHWEKLYRPNETVFNDENDQISAYIVDSCSLAGRDALTLHCWSWEFDGKFFRQEKELQIQWPSSSESIFMTNLQVYPLRFDNTELEGRLERRGREFWYCRHRRFVSYDVPLKGMEIQIVRYAWISF